MLQCARCLLTRDPQVAGHVRAKPRSTQVACEDRHPRQTWRSINSVHSGTPHNQHCHWRPQHSTKPRASARARVSEPRPRRQMCNRTSQAHPPSPSTPVWGRQARQPECRQNPHPELELEPRPQSWTPARTPFEPALCRFSKGGELVDVGQSNLCLSAPGPLSAADAMSVASVLQAKGGPFQDDEVHA